MGDLNTPLLFCRAGVVVVKRLCGGKNDEYDEETTVGDGTDADDGVGC